MWFIGISRENAHKRPSELADLENQLVISIDLTDTTTATDAEIITIIAISTKDTVTTSSNNSVTVASEGGAVIQ